MSEITVDLTGKGLDKAIAELEKYRSYVVKDYTERLLDVITERMADRIHQGFNSAEVNVNVYGGSDMANVTVNIIREVGRRRIEAIGREVAFIEFGAGVYFNGSAGQSPNPNGARLGFTIGSYGKGHGARQVWGYYANDDPTDLRLTQGTPAKMPMTETMLWLRAQLLVVAKEVWKFD